MDKITITQGGYRNLPAKVKALFVAEGDRWTYTPPKVPKMTVCDNCGVSTRVSH